MVRQPLHRPRNQRRRRKLCRHQPMRREVCIHDIHPRCFSQISCRSDGCLRTDVIPAQNEKSEARTRRHAEFGDAVPFIHLLNMQSSTRLHVNGSVAALAAGLHPAKHGIKREVPCQWQRSNSSVVSCPAKHEIMVRSHVNGSGREQATHGIMVRSHVNG